MSLAIRLATVYGTMFLFTGVYLPFFPVWLKSEGLAPTEISLVVALSLFLRIVVSPFFAAVADRLGDRRRVILWLAWVSLAVGALFLLVEGFGPILLVSLVLNAVFPSIGPLVETISMRARIDHGMNYGRVRLWGSITFVGASVGAGWLLEWNPPSIIAVCLVAALAFNIAGLWLLPREVGRLRKPVPSGRQFADVLQIGRHPVFILFVLTASLTQATHAVYYAFGSLAWQLQGYSDSVIGLLWATGVLAEIVLFYISGPLMARFGAVRLLMLAAAAAILRWTVTALSPPLALLFVMQALHGLTFGAAHLGAVQFVAQAAPPRLAATAQSLYAAMASGVMMGLVTIGMGPIYERLGPYAYFVMAGAGAVALAGAVLVAMCWNGDVLVPEEEQEEENGN
ncbi:major facilitator superfamily MFS_1 [Parvibaculum lavamentivorans DS-1]|uniref:Major facilitator superfamily MFS_1 n=1 Tax=Parvibaculum lavamentivorans (strain DS-1 / DSM 13023 / NCIMB 13966) TaxID=402881 RepID=A7HW29_PARL1|nr:MFS transporter [Parvibaculum lavamentivorans]ABS64112.1 major facilitator superfamily MFS_1 [Parvibaculum lavamentivorans DS-1]